jgi:hypothetical protein
MIKKGGAMFGGLKNEAEEAVSKYIANMSPQQCTAVGQVWSAFEKTIKDKFSGALEEAVLQLMEEPEPLQAELLMKAMKGLGTDEETLSRILGGNHKHVSASIARTFFKKYDKELSVEIKSEVGGNFQNALVTWIAGEEATGTLEQTLKFYRTEMAANRLSAAQLQSFEEVLRNAIANAKVCAIVDVSLIHYYLTYAYVFSSFKSIHVSTRSCW